jgi:hypothetical protein
MMRLNHVRMILPAFAASLLLSQCSAEVVHRASAWNIVHRDKLEGQGEFIGFAGGKAFKYAKPAALFPWSPRRAIWWCYESELTPEQRAKLLRSKEAR